MTFTIMDSLKKYIRRSVIGVFCLGALASCSEDNLLNSEPSNQEGEAGYITFRCSDMLETFVGSNNPAGTRAGGPKNPEEKAIKTLHVFFFGPTGNLLQVEEYDNFNSYQRVDGKSFIKIPTGDGVRKELKEQLENVHIVAIANIDATDDAESATDDANKFRTKYSTGGMIRKAGRNAEADTKAPAGMAGDGNPYEISTYEQLTKWVYYPRIRMNEDGTGDITSLPEAGMPMVGEKRGVNLSKKPSETIVVDLIAMMAKVNVSVELDPDQYTDQYPLLRITGYGVRNMPIAIPYLQPDGTGPDSGKPTHKQYLENYDVTKVPMFHKGDQPSDPTHMVCVDEAHEVITSANVTINKDSEPATFSYYTFENINLPDYSATGPNGFEYFDDNHNVSFPKGVAKDNYERWKSNFAYSDRASALILKGEYTTHQGLKYNAQFTVFLGSTYDNTGKPLDEKERSTNFQVKRNHRYDNNIIIHGLDYIRNSDEDVYNFDGRVNVVDNNPFYLAIVNERKVDAHASALPMDVWFMYRENGGGSGKEVATFDHNSSIKISIPEDCNWVRMVMIPRKEMEDAKFEPGTGIEPYFYTDLLQRIDNKTSILDHHYEGADCGREVTINCTPNLNNSRSRIYFYIDENVPTDNNGTNYGDRKVRVKIEYTTDKEGVSDRSMNLEIEQKSLKRVVTQTGSDFDTRTEISWMEVVEEYLDHNDPLDPHNEYGEYYKDGLPWGLEGVDVNKDFTNDELRNSDLGTRFEPYRVYSKIGAFRMTTWAIIDRNDPLTSDSLFNRVKPTSAFHYCFGKNKRNSDGSASYEYQSLSSGRPFYIYKGNKAKGWYMPGIRELESAFLTYYDDEDCKDFRGNFYWSAACANKSSQTNNNNDHARATKIIVSSSGGAPTYAESHPKDSDHSTSGPGYQERKEKNRIRAFYRVD